MEVIFEKDAYKIYEEHDNLGNEYYLCIPNSDSSEYSIFCGLSKDNVSHEKRVSEVFDVYDNISRENKNVIYVDALVEIKKLVEASYDNDQKLYNFLLDGIHETIRHARGSIDSLKASTEKKINNVITMVKRDEDDTKFIDWLEINMPNNVNSISLFHNHYSDNVSDVTGELPIVDSEETMSKDIQSNYTKKRIPVKNSYGFGNIILVTIVLTILFAIGIAIAYIIIK